MQNQVKIIGGEWRSRIIYFPKLPELRPTPSRLRETLFNWLGQNLEGKRCLDLFAGSGALGFEALSRGAKQVVMVESNGNAHTALMENARRLGANNLNIYGQDAWQFLMQQADNFDVIFLDPPFHMKDVSSLVLAIAPRLADEGFVYLESALRIEQFAGLTQVRQKKAGKVNSYLMRKAHA